MKRTKRVASARYATIPREIPTLPPGLTLFMNVQNFDHSCKALLGILLSKEHAVLDLAVGREKIAGNVLSALVRWHSTPLFSTIL